MFSRMASLETLKKVAVSGVPLASVLVAPTGLKLEKMVRIWSTDMCFESEDI